MKKFLIILFIILVCFFWALFFPQNENIKQINNSQKNSLAKISSISLEEYLLQESSISYQEIPIVNNDITNPLDLWVDFIWRYEHIYKDLEDKQFYTTWEDVLWLYNTFSQEEMDSLFLNVISNWEWEAFYTLLEDDLIQVRDAYTKEVVFETKIEKQWIPQFNDFFFYDSGWVLSYSPNAYVAIWEEPLYKIVYNWADLLNDHNVENLYNPMIIDGKLVYFFEDINNTYIRIWDQNIKLWDWEIMHDKCCEFGVFNRNPSGFFWKKEDNIWYFISFWTD